MTAATQIAYARFDAAFFALPKNVQDRIRAKIDVMGLRLDTFSHHRLTGSDRFRLRIGDYRVIYSIDLRENVIHLYAVGHRREVYR